MNRTVCLPLRPVAGVVCAFAFSLAACGGNGGGGHDEQRKTFAPPADTPKTEDGTRETTPPTPLFGETEGVASAQGVFRAKAAWGEAPRAGAPATVVVTIAGPDRLPPASFQKFTFRPWMPSMSHGIGHALEDVTFAATAEAPWVITVSNIVFTMGGAWELQIGAEVAGRADTVAIPVSVQ